MTDQVSVSLDTSSKVDHPVKVEINEAFSPSGIAEAPQGQDEGIDFTRTGGTASKADLRGTLDEKQGGVSNAFLEVTTTPATMHTAAPENKATQGTEGHSLAYTAGEAVGRARATAEAAATEGIAAAGRAGQAVLEGGENAASMAATAAAQGAAAAGQLGQAMTESAVDSAKGGTAALGEAGRYAAETAADAARGGTAALAEAGRSAADASAETARQGSEAADQAARHLTDWTATAAQQGTSETGEAGWGVAGAAADTAGEEGGLEIGQYGEGMVGPAADTAGDGAEASGEAGQDQGAAAAADASEDEVEAARPAGRGVADAAADTAGGGADALSEPGWATAADTAQQGAGAAADTARGGTQAWGQAGRDWTGTSAARDTAKGYAVAHKQAIRNILASTNDTALEDTAAEGHAAGTAEREISPAAEDVTTADDVTRQGVGEGDSAGPQQLALAAEARSTEDWQHQQESGDSQQQQPAEAAAAAPSGLAASKPTAAATSPMAQSLAGKSCIIIASKPTPLLAELTQSLLQRGAQVSLAVKHPQDSQMFVKSICNRLPAAVQPLLASTESPVNLASQESIRRFASGVNSSTQPLDLLLLDTVEAGGTARRWYTAEGVAGGAQTSFLGPAYLLHLLQPKLAASSTAILLTSSPLHRLGTLDDLGSMLHSWAGAHIADTQLALLVYVRQLADRLREYGVRAAAVDVGILREQPLYGSLLRKVPPLPQVLHLLLASAADSAHLMTGVAEQLLSAGTSGGSSNAAEGGAHQQQQQHHGVGVAMGETDATLGQQQQQEQQEQQIGQGVNGQWLAGGEQAAEGPTAAATEEQQQQQQAGQWEEQILHEGGEDQEAGRGAGAGGLTGSSEVEVDVEGPSATRSAAAQRPHYPAGAVPSQGDTFTGEAAAAVVPSAAAASTEEDDDDSGRRSAAYYAGEAVGRAQATAEAAAADGTAAMGRAGEQARSMIQEGAETALQETAEGAADAASGAAAAVDKVGGRTTTEMTWGSAEATQGGADALDLSRRADVTSDSAAQAAEETATAAGEAGWGVAGAAADTAGEEGGLEIGQYGEGMVGSAADTVKEGAAAVGRAAGTAWDGAASAVDAAQEGAAAVQATGEKVAEGAADAVEGMAESVEGLVAPVAEMKSFMYISRGLLATPLLTSLDHAGRATWITRALSSITYPVYQLTSSSVIYTSMLLDHPARTFLLDPAGAVASWTQAVLGKRAAGLLAQLQRGVPGVEGVPASGGMPKWVEVAPAGLVVNEALGEEIWTLVDAVCAQH